MHILKIFALTNKVKCLVLILNLNLFYIKIFVFDYECKNVQGIVNVSN